MDNVEFLIDGNTWNIISKGLKGIDFPNFNLYTEPSAITDGSVVTGSQAPSRNITITAYNTNQKYNETDRAVALKFFNPKNTYKIYIHYQNVTRWIKGRISALSVPSQNIHRRLELKVMFFCENPYLRSVNEFAKDVKGITSGWAFPFIQTSSIKVIPAIFNFSNEVFLANNGDVPANFRAVLNFTGNVINPYIQKGNVLFKLNKSFINGDNLIIDFENHKVELNGSNAMKYVDKISSFEDMKIDVNGSVIEVNSTSGDTYMSCVIYYNQLYGGM